MKKNYILAGAILLASTFVFAQQNRMVGDEATMKPAPASQGELKNIPIPNLTKATDDTLFYDDLSSFATNGWVSTDFTQNGYDFIHSTQAPGGQFSTTIGPLASTTGANGYISGRFDFYNTPLPQTPVAMDVIITSSAINITPGPSVLVRFQQGQRYCCQTTNILDLEVSTDSVSWTSYSAKFGRGANTNVTLENAEINISAAAANASTVYLRFRSNGNSHYYWMIDDIAIVEGPKDNVRVDQVFSTFGSAFRDGFYTIQPLDLTQPLQFLGGVLNYGSNTATDVKLHVDVSNSSGSVYNDSTTGISQNQLQNDTVSIVSTYGNTDGYGDYTISYSTTSDSVNEHPATAVRDVLYTVGDTVFAKDYDVAGGSVGPGSYVGGDNDGSRIGTKFTIGGTNPQTVTSVSYFIANRSENTGAEIRAKIWAFDTTQATLNDAFTAVVAQNPIPYVIQASDLGTWLTIPIVDFATPGPGVALSPGQYVLAAEQSAGNLNGFELYLGRDISAEAFQPFGTSFTSFVFANDAAPAWGNIFNQPMMRMNFGLLVGIEEAKASINSFTVAPNPNDGQFKVEVLADNAKFNLSVRNIMGQVVYSQDITVNNSLRKDIDLSNLDKGMYFVTLENEVNREVQKVIIK